MDYDFERESSDGIGEATEVSSSENILDMFMAEIKHYPPITREEAVELHRRTKEGDQEAREKLITSNLGLVISQAKEKMQQVANATSVNVTLEDLIQEGTMGLITAIEKYDPERGAFSVVAYYWIQKAIRRFLNTAGRTIRIPDTQINELLFINAAEQILSVALSRAPTLAELRGYMNNRFTESEISKMQGLLNNITPLSLDCPFGGDDEDDATLGETIADSEEFKEEKDGLDELKDQLEKKINSFSPKEQIVVRYSFGIGVPKTTFKDISDILFKNGFTNKKGGKMSRQATHKVYAKCLEKIKPLVQKYI